MNRKVNEDTKENFYQQEHVVNGKLLDMGCGEDDAQINWIICAQIIVMLREHDKRHAFEVIQVRTGGRVHMELSIVMRARDV